MTPACQQMTQWNRMKPPARRRRKPQKVGSKLERSERVYKETAKAQRDFLRKRRSKGAGVWLNFFAAGKK